MSCGEEANANLASQSGFTGRSTPRAGGNLRIGGHSGSRRGRSFQANDATDERGSRRPLVRRQLQAAAGAGDRSSAALQRGSFEMRAVRSWSLDGELVRGRLFCLDKSNMRPDWFCRSAFWLARMAVCKARWPVFAQTPPGHVGDREERLRLARDLSNSCN